MYCWCYKNYISWIVLFFSALNVIFLGGKRRAFGSFVATLKSSYPNITLTELNWIGDSYSALGYMSTSLTTALIIHAQRRYRIFQFVGSVFVLVSCLTSAFVPSPHWLFLTHTLLHGVGSSLILSNIGLIIGEYFDINHRYHILATTLVSGGSVASIVFVYFFAAIIQAYGWRAAFVIFGVLYLIVTSSATVVFQRAEYALNNESNQTKKSRRCQRMLRGRQVPLVILWIVDRTLTSVVTYGLLMNLTNFVHRSVASLTDSSILTMIFAAGEAMTYLIGAVLTAITKGLLRNRLKYILLVSSFMMAVSLVAIEFVPPQDWTFKVLIFTSGFCLGPSITFLYPAGEEMTTLPGHLAYPISLGGMGLGMMVSPLLSAKIAELFNYRWFFLIQGGLILVKFAALLAMTFLTQIFVKRNSEMKCIIVDEEVE